MLHRDRRALRPVFRAHCLLLAALVSVLAGFWAHAAEHEGFPRTVVDGLGKEIELLSPPQRIFSTALAVDNVLLALVEPERVWASPVSRKIRSSPTSWTSFATTW